MAQAVEFKYAPMFQLGKDDTQYYLLTKDYVSEGEFEGHKILKIQPEALTLMARQAFHDTNFMLRRSHNELVAKILKDPEATENDKYIALSFLRKPPPKASFLSAKTPARPSSMEKRVKRFGPVSAMKRRFPWGSFKRTPPTTCVILKTRRFLCTKKRTPCATFPLKLIWKRLKATSTTSCVLSKAVARQTRAISFRKPKRF